MTFKNINPSGGVPQCVYWNFNLANHTGGWDSSGCYVHNVDGDSVSCICDHLTSFSILMSPDSPYPGSLLGILLDIISYIGLCFSILSLAACLVVEAVVWKSVTKNRTSYMRHTCIVNIAASLLVADIWFIVAAAIHDHFYPLNETACVAATFFIHFFYLSVFFWMLTLGLMLFYRLVFILGFWSCHCVPRKQCCVPYYIYTPQCLSGKFCRARFSGSICTAVTWFLGGNQKPGHGFTASSAQVLTRWNLGRQPGLWIHSDELTSCWVAFHPL